MCDNRARCLSFFDPVYDRFEQLIRPVLGSRAATTVSCARQEVHFGEHVELVHATHRLCGVAIVALQLGVDAARVAGTVPHDYFAAAFVQASQIGAVGSAEPNPVRRLPPRIQLLLVVEVKVLQHVVVGSKEDFRERAGNDIARRSFSHVCHRRVVRPGRRCGTKECRPDTDIGDRIAGFDRPAGSHGSRHDRFDRFEFWPGQALRPVGSRAFELLEIDFAGVVVPDDAVFGAIEGIALRRDFAIQHLQLRRRYPRSWLAVHLLGVIDKREHGGVAAPARRAEQHAVEILRVPFN